MMSENGKASGPDTEKIAPAGADQPSDDMADDTTAAEQTEDTEASEDAASPRKKKRFGPWLFLLLIFIGLPLAWFFSPPEMQQQADDVLTQFMAQVTPQHTAKQASTTLPTNEPATGIMQQAETTTPKTIAPETEAPSTSGETAETAASNQPPSQSETTVETDVSEAENMRQGIERLQYELTAVQIENSRLRTQIQARQKQTLSFLLRLLAQPQTRLAQHAELWNDIASLPIDAEGKSLAESMAKLANDNLSLIKTWRQTLIRLADSIPDAVQTDILPKPENKYIAWLIGTFHLRPAANESALMQTTLKHRLLDMEHAFSLGAWPEQKEWRFLMVALHGQFGADAELGLPETELLLPVLREIDMLQQTAAKWLEDL